MTEYSINKESFDTPNIYTDYHTVIQVYDKLHMLNPDITVEELLMAPNSALKLQTNR